MKMFPLVISLLGLALLPVSANEDPEQAKKEKIDWFTEVKQCADQDKKCLTEELANPDLNGSVKQISSQILQTYQKIGTAADAGVAAAKSGSFKAIQAAEDECNSLRDSKEILELKRECANEILQLRERAASDPAVTALVAKVEEEYTRLIAKEEESKALHKQSDLSRRQIEVLKRQIRIAELDREKKSLESQ
jgi:hypothetical protein